MRSAVRLTYCRCGLKIRHSRINAVTESRLIVLSQNNNKFHKRWIPIVGMGYGRRALLTHPGMDLVGYTGTLPNGVLDRYV